MRRREFLGLIGSTAAMPLAARAQQTTPVVGFLNYQSDTIGDLRRAFSLGLKDTGYVEGDNIAVDYRWADNQIDRLPTLAAELVRRRVAVIVTSGGPASAFAAKAATPTIPIVFTVNEDPVKLGLVASLARPGGNLTGINFFNAELVAKRLELLRELLPKAARVAVLINPANVTTSTSTLRDVEVASRTIGVQLTIFNASTSSEIDAVFTALARERPDALFVGGDAFFYIRRVQLVSWAIRQGLPATYSLRDYAEVGGLMSYGTNLADAFRQAGTYAGKILKGAKPTDLPVVQSTKLDLVINAQTARTLGLTVPPTLLARADEVIE